MHDRNEQAKKHYIYCKTLIYVSSDDTDCDMF